ncbi:hypothetical protein [Stenotrophomonas oahuensis]|uniref:Uncharacterized protein n=1 Tax=Stenotrophomonas oahuensis TaxID=3003271 RepID=A0ABY9YKV8_9GAMM|nr:hypothetical protein [Stenotrophomonas sp. A5586]WNH50894.1 hypothetical protein PDM29_10870 [Stenotrophomonas sp. A5586]
MNLKNLLMTLLAIWAASNTLTASAAAQYYECIIHGTDGKPIDKDIGPGLVIPTVYYIEVSSEAEAVTEAMKSAKIDSVPASSAKCRAVELSPVSLQILKSRTLKSDADY